MWAQVLSFVVQLVTAAEVVLFVASGLGLLAHFIRKRARGEVSGSLWSYLIVTPGYTVATLVALVAADFTIVGVGQLESMALHVVFALGFTTGYTLDSAIAAPVAPAAGASPELVPSASPGPI